MNSNVLIFTRQEGEEDWKFIPKEGYDLIVFTGGYFVSGYLSNEQLAKQFMDIIQFKIENKNVLLLLSEDDLQYLDDRVLGGHRPDGARLFKSLLSRCKEHFNTMYEGLYGRFDSNMNWPIKGYFINHEFHEFDKPKHYKHKNQRSLEFNEIDGQKVGIFIPFMDNVDPKLVKAQRKVFKLFGAKINQLLWKGFGGHPHSEFVNHVVDNIDCDYYVLFDIDSIPMRPDFLQILIKRAGKTKICGAEQTTDFISNIPFAAPSCFIISKDLYNKMGRPKFDPTERSDDTQELTHLAWEQGIEVDFIKFATCRIPNYYWKFEDGRQYGYGSYYEDLVYHNFQARYDKFTAFFFEECENIMKKYS